MSISGWIIKQQVCQNKDVAQSEAEAYESKEPRNLVFMLVTAR